jgi:hypothetical protein
MQSKAFLQQMLTHFKDTKKELFPSFKQKQTENEQKCSNLWNRLRCAASDLYKLKLHLHKRFQFDILAHVAISTNLLLLASKSTESEEF